MYVTRTTLLSGTLLAALATGFYFIPGPAVWHIGPGLLFVGVVAAHLMLQRRWLAGAIRRLLACHPLGRRLRATLRWEALLGLTFTAMVLSGLWQWAGGAVAKPWHASLSMLFLGAAAWHVVVHRRRLVPARRRTTHERPDT